MSKQLFVDPNGGRAPGKITFTDIPVNTYQKKVKDELGNFTTEQFKTLSATCWCFVSSRP